MFFSNLFKQLKRRLKMRKRWLSLGAFLLVAGASVVGVWIYDESPGVRQEWSTVGTLGHGVGEFEDVTAAATEEVLRVIRSGQEKREVYVQKNYVCGEETEKLGQLAPAEILSLYKEYNGARMSMDKEGSVYLLLNVDDLAPTCKDNAYFGLDDGGNLSLFEGVPEQERVIRTFFQLNVEHLKSSLPQDTVNQLYSGIRISDLADYNSVLSTFSEFAAEEAEPVTNMPQQ